MGWWIALGVFVVVLAAGWLARWALGQARARLAQAINAAPSLPRTTAEAAAMLPSSPAEAVAMLPAAAVARAPSWLAPDRIASRLGGVAPPGGSDADEVDVVEYEDFRAISAPPSPPAPAMGQSASKDPTSDRYVGSAALESTLDSTIESSLLGVPSGPVTAALLPGASVLELSSQLRGQVITFMADGHEVAAVQLLCDELGCTILEAVQTVRSVN